MLGPLVTRRPHGLARTLFGLITRLTDSSFLRLTRSRAKTAPVVSALLYTLLNQPKDAVRPILAPALRNLRIERTVQAAHN